MCIEAVVGLAIYWFFCGVGFFLTLNRREQRFVEFLVCLTLGGLFIPIRIVQKLVK